MAGADALAHLAACSACAGEVARLRRVSDELDALGRAERVAATAAFDAAAVLAAVAAPSPIARVPLALAGALRGARECVRPAFAASATALAVGLAAGTWLAITTPEGGASAAAGEIYDASNLLDASASGLSTQYFDSASGSAETRGDFDADDDAPDAAAPFDSGRAR